MVTQSVTGCIPTQSVGTIKVHPRPMHGANSFESSIRLAHAPCINDSTGTLRHNKRTAPMWTKPTYTDLRIGFEVTMYFANR
jgi:pyrroloquinoline quinone biosynthesis protein A